MSEHSTIEWTDATWNPVTGCSVVSPGCTHCYAMRLAGTRLQHHPSRAGLTVPGKAGPVWNGEVRLYEAWLPQPLQWKRPRMIFVCAHGDLFHEAVPDAWIDRVFAIMGLCPQHTFQVLTKRSARMRAYMSNALGRVADAAIALRRSPPAGVRSLDAGPVVPLPHVTPGRAWWPLPNIWLGVSTEDQRRADERVPDLLATPAAVRFVSAEPLLGPIDFEAMPFAEGDPRHRWSALTGQAIMYANGENGRPDFTVRLEKPIKPRLDWIIVGGESGPKARAMHPTWAREIRDQCDAAGVAFFFKQWGAWQPRQWCRDGGTHAMRDSGGQISFQQIQSHPNSMERVGVGPDWQAFDLVGSKAAGRLLDGREHNGLPGARP